MLVCPYNRPEGDPTCPARVCAVCVRKFTQDWADNFGLLVSHLMGLAELPPHLQDVFRVVKFRLQANQEDLETIMTMIPPEAQDLLKSMGARMSANYRDFVAVLTLMNASR